MPSIISKKVLLRTQRINQAPHSWCFLFIDILVLIECNISFMKLLLSLLIFSMLYSQDLIGTWILKAHYNNYRLFTRHSQGQKIGPSHIHWLLEYALARGGENIMQKIKTLI